MKKLTGKLQDRNGFSLSETLVALTILLMVASLMTSGISLASNVHRKIVDKANAQTLLSTTMTELRTKLTNVSEVTVPEGGKTIAYIDIDTNNHVTIASTADGITVEDGASTYMLVSDETASKSMLVECKFSYSEGIVTVSNITVKKDGTVLAEMPSYLIRNW